MNKNNTFGINKQIAWVEMELLKMEEDFNYLLENFGQAYATKMFAQKRQTYERLTCIKESLEKLEAMQRNLGTLSPSIFETLTKKQLSEEGVLDAIVRSLNSSYEPKKFKNL